MNSLVKSLEFDIKQEIVPLLNIHEFEYISDANYASVFKSAFEKVRSFYNDIGSKANQIVNQFVGILNSRHKDKFYKNAKALIGESIGESIANNENISNQIIGATRENIALITSISDKHLTDIESIVWSGLRDSVSANNMIASIRKKTDMTYNRAKLIARDQTAKLTATLNQARQKAMGVEEYRWRTVGDNKVRPNHASKNGLIFKWDKPPTDTGHPGTEINCRCIAQPIINFDYPFTNVST